MGYPDDNTLEEIEHGMSLIYDKEEHMSMDATDPWRDTAKDVTPGGLIAMIEESLKSLKELQAKKDADPTPVAAVIAVLLQMNLTHWIRRVTPVMDEIIKRGKARHEEEAKNSESS